MAAFTSLARSCWVQWPQPSSMTWRLSCGTMSRSLASLDSGKRHHQVAVAGDVEGGHGNLRAGEGCEQLPVAVGVAIPVETAAEAGSGELGGVEIEIGRRQPRRQGRRLAPLAKKAGPANRPCRRTAHQTCRPCRAAGRRTRHAACARVHSWGRAQARPRQRRAPGSRAGRTSPCRSSASPWSAGPVPRG